MFAILLTVLADIQKKEFFLKHYNPLIFDLGCYNNVKLDVSSIGDGKNASYVKTELAGKALIMLLNCYSTTNEFKELYKKIDRSFDYEDEEYNNFYGYGKKVCTIIKRHIVDMVKKRSNMNYKLECSSNISIDNSLFERMYKTMKIRGLENKLQESIIQNKYKLTIDLILYIIYKQIYTPFCQNNECAKYFVKILYDFNTYQTNLDVSHYDILKQVNNENNRAVQSRVESIRRFLVATGSAAKNNCLHVNLSFDFLLHKKEIEQLKKEEVLAEIRSKKDASDLFIVVSIDLKCLKLEFYDYYNNLPESLKKRHGSDEGYKLGLELDEILKIENYDLLLTNLVVYKNKMKECLKFYFKYIKEIRDEAAKIRNKTGQEKTYKILFLKDELANEEFLSQRYEKSFLLKHLETNWDKIMNIYNEIYRDLDNYIRKQFDEKESSFVLLQL